MNRITSNFKSNCLTDMECFMNESEASFKTGSISSTSPEVRFLKETCFFELTSLRTEGLRALLRRRCMSEMRPRYESPLRSTWTDSTSHFCACRFLQKERRWH